MKTVRIASVLVCACSLFAGLLLIGCSGDGDRGTAPMTGSWNWKPLAGGLNAPANAFQEYKGRLYVGGNFTQAGGASAWFIASWTGSEWVPLSSGMEFRVYALTVYRERLIAGGFWFNVNGIRVNSVAAYDGDSWSALGNGLPGPYVVKDLCVLGDTLFATGYHWVSDSMCAFVAAWDGSTWSMIESGTPGVIEDACVHDGKLIVGGIHNINGIGRKFVAARVNGNWHDYDSSNLPGSVYDLFSCTYGLFVSGGSSSYPVKRFSDSWENVGTVPFGNNGGFSYVYAMCELGGKLIVAGIFTTIGNDTFNNIASWWGSFWMPLSGGISNSSRVQCVGTWQNRLYVSGEFTEIDGQEANYIAEWSYQE